MDLGLKDGLSGLCYDNHSWGIVETTAGIFFPAWAISYSNQKRAKIETQMLFLKNDKPRAANSADFPPVDTELRLHMLCK